MKPLSISARLPQLPADKANHFVYGVGIFVVGAALLNAPVALALVVLIAVAKEIYDGVTSTGTRDVWDAVATAAGGAAGFICTLV